MFDKMTHEDLLKLTSVQDGPCISIYIPAMPGKTLQLEYEALVRRASHLLVFDERKVLRESLLEILNKFNPAEHFTPQDKGLALFVNKHWSSFFLAGHELPSKTVVADSFHLKPLLEDLQGAHTYRTLVISGEEAVLLQSDSGKINETHTFLFHHGQHSSSIHWKHQDESETVQLPNLQAHTRGRGQGDSKFKNRSTKLFVKWIEAKISKEDGFKAVPLYVFTNEALFQAFNEVTSHPKPEFCKMQTTGGVPRIETLTHQANLQVQKKISEQKTVSSHSAGELARRKLVIDDLFKISKAALGGQVRTLYLRDNIEIWGHFRRKSGEITFHEKQLDAKDDDILDDIACEVIRHGGEVVVLTGKEMPTSSPAAAILSG